MSRGPASAIVWLAFATSLVLLALAVATPAEAARFWRWKDERGTPTYADHPPVAEGLAVRDALRSALGSAGGGVAA